MRVRATPLALSLIVLASVGTVGVLGRVPTPAHAQTRPNILFILVDDANYRQAPAMSNLQSMLVQQGTSFPNYFDSEPVCCPARAGILSGQYNHNNKVLNNNGTAK